MRQCSHLKKLPNIRAPLHSSIFPKYGSGLGGRLIKGRKDPIQFQTANTTTIQIFIFEARIGLFRRLCSTSARPKTSKSGGIYLPNRFIFGRLLFVGAAEFNPITMFLQHFVQILDGARVVEKGRTSYDADNDLCSILFTERCFNYLASSTIWIVIDSISLAI
jgi:hypothetical protein